MEDYVDRILNLFRSYAYYIVMSRTKKFRRVSYKLNDELEAMRLAGLEGLYQEEAAMRMNVSRATFGRVINEAHQKVADTIIYGKVLTIVSRSVREG